MLFHSTTGNTREKIIFIHGNSESGEVWKTVIPQIQSVNDYTCVAVDLPGHGNSFRSKEPAKDYSLKGLSEQVKQFIEPYQDNPYLLVAHSLGTNLVGEIAQSLQNCRGFFLLAPDIIGTGLTMGDIFRPNPNTNVLFTPEPTQEALEALAKDMVQDQTEETIALIKRMFLATDPLLRKELMESIVKEEWIDEVGAFISTGLPVALCYGENEEFCFTDYLNRSAIQKWRDKIFLVPASKHCPQLDNPETLAMLIKEFAKDCFK